MAVIILIAVKAGALCLVSWWQADFIGIWAVGVLLAFFVVVDTAVAAVARASASAACTVEEACVSLCADAEVGAVTLFGALLCVVAAAQASLVAVSEAAVAVFADSTVTDAVAAIRVFCSVVGVGAGNDEGECAL